MSQTVLVADDSKTIRQIVEMALKASSWEVVGVNTAQDAMNAARQNPSVILLDYYMPDGSGYDVCRALKQDSSTRTIPIVMLGGTYKEFDEGRAREAGADVVLMKPFKTDALLNAIEDAQNAETALPLPAMPPPVEPNQRVEPDPPTTESEPQLDEESDGYGYGEPAIGDDESSDAVYVAAPKSDPVYDLPMDDDEDDLPRPGASFAQPTPTPPPIAPPTPTPVPAAPARGVSSPSISPAPSRPEPVASGLSREDIETMIHDQVKAAVKNELPGLLRNVMAEIFQQKIMPKLTEHADARIHAVVNDTLSAQIQKQVRSELERLLNEE